MHDLLIHNALIVDGTGREPFTGMLAVTDGLISLIEPEAEPLPDAREVIDADGKALMPGIIDGHTHYDAQITWDPLVDPSPSLGVTTVVMGNCGFTIAPCRPADRDLTMRNLTQVEGMSLQALRDGVRWEFESFPEYLAMLERRGVGPNVAAFIGHSGLRTYVMGEAATQRAANDDEIRQMADIVREAMRAGAIGLASTTSEAHNGDNAIPMPSRLADEGEMLALTGAMGESGHGLFMLTGGSKTTLEAVERIAEHSGRPVRLVWGFLDNPVRPGGALKNLQRTAQIRERGRRLYPEVSCAPLTMDFTLRNAYPLEGYGAWEPAMTADDADLPAVYRDPQFRERMKEELERFKGRRLFNSDWEKVTVSEAAGDANRALEGRSIAELAAERGQHPLDTMLDIGLAEDLETLFEAKLLNSDEKAVGELISDPDAYIGLSDAGAHLSFLCDAGFGLHLLGRWVRELQRLSLAQAVHKLTGQPARIMGITDRGELAVGKAADLLWFDPAAVGRGPKRRVHDLPGGVARVTTPGLGVLGVWVNGVRMVDADGAVRTDRLPGRVLREFAA
ncbi:MAG: amidohydrolase family protein [Burkholderiaceae bacterium]